MPGLGAGGKNLAHEDQILPAGCILARSPLTLLFSVYFEAPVHFCLESYLSSSMYFWSPNLKTMFSVIDLGPEWCLSTLKRDDI